MARYCDAKDLRALVPDLYRDAALADSAGGTDADAGLLAAVLESACNETDALIEGRVRLPLATVPRKLRVAAAYIALELLHIRRGRPLPEDTAEKIKWWRNWLSKVGEGELRLDAPDPDGATGGSGHTSSIAVRPAVTGSHGLMFSLALALSLFALVPAETSRAVEARTWAFDLPAAADVFDNPAEMEWAAGESLVLSYAGGSLSAGQTARWEVAGGTNLWLSESASVSGTAWTWHLAPTQTVFPAGRYAGRIAVYATDGGTTSFHRVAALQSVRVHAGNSGLATVAPLVVRLDDYALLDWVEGEFEGLDDRFIPMWPGWYRLDDTSTTAFDRIGLGMYRGRTAGDPKELHLYSGEHPLVLKSFFGEGYYGEAPGITLKAEYHDEMLDKDRRGRIALDGDVEAQGDFSGPGILAYKGESDGLARLWGYGAVLDFDEGFSPGVLVVGVGDSPIRKAPSASTRRTA